ncbi:presequence translocated-associated motor subunit pam-17 [Uncinocarpus reesii 1704]|uniref:Presequence translocated-associated motor subunit PAM17 n=1 Tax=Uncinocarpus reesii (strain UAMH 1704) TaxID=336963 RepID=C4JUB5_UNCRE|nr:presequence translocated-associated motor subunit pam-17 [Uncinocarpus reesii 1704]EEP81212.1 presequence translocated-associated motor subunit pam-17 [Uncinocarpus reesii 1704]
MNLTVMSCPVRTAALGGRVVWPTLAAVSCPSASQTTTRRQYQENRFGRYPEQRRAASSSTRAAFGRPISCYLYQPPAMVPAAPTSIVAQATSLRRASSSAAQTHDSSSVSSSQTPVRLDWNSFFTLRASRRKYSLVSSILASLTTTAAGAQVIASQNFEALGAQIMGFDPFIVLGLTTIACGAVGWLAGPVLGNSVWGLVYRKYKGAVVVKEKEFYDRIKRFRVDPSANSFANPVPDYYGEKIGSVQGYRQWLKDQRAYNRKKRNFV